MSTILGLDIGTEFVKAVLAKPGKKGALEILGVGKARQKEGNMHAGAIADIPAVVSVCEEALSIAEEEAKERARKAPGCHSKDNVDILTFSSHNNLLTVGNNTITMKIRNRNPYDVIVSVSFKYSDSNGWDPYIKSYEIGGNKIRTIDTLGDAWSRAKDVTIVAVH